MKLELENYQKHFQCKIASKCCVQNLLPLSVRKLEHTCGNKSYKSMKACTGNGSSYLPKSLWKCPLPDFQRFTTLCQCWRPVQYTTCHYLFRSSNSAISWTRIQNFIDMPTFSQRKRAASAVNKWFYITLNFNDFRRFVGFCNKSYT